MNSLCETCRHCREIISGKGSRFLLCQLSRQDTRYPKYPPQPVRTCRGYEVCPPLVYESFQVFGPADFGGRYFRVIGYQVSGGGYGWSCEVWSSGRWLSPVDGPGCPEIMAAVPASSEELLQAGVDGSPLPSNYDPLSVECEGSVGCANGSSEPGAAPTDGA